MSAYAAESRTFRLSGRLSVEFTVSGAGACVEWDPAPPDRLTAKEWRRYRAARDAMMQRLERRLGINVMVVEI